MRAPAVILWLVVTVVWLTWAPFAPRLQHPPTISVRLEPDDVAANLLLWVPLGIAFVCVSRQGRRSRRLAITVSAIGAVLVEAGQVFFEGRTVSFTDPLFNTLGVALAVWALVMQPRVGRLVPGFLGS